MRVIPLCVVLGGWLSMPALAADADEWLERLIEAEQQKSFSGTFVYGRAGTLTSHAVWQQVEGATVSERFVRLDGTPAEVLRVDGEVQCSTDEFATRVASGRGWHDGQLDIQALQAIYDVGVIGESRVAGRPTVALSILPKDQHRYGFELHLDRETALPLKSLLLSESGQSLERFQFISLTPGAVDATDLQPGDVCQTVTPQQETSRDAGSAWHSEWLPAGFRLLGAGARTSPVSDAAVDWLAYGDGVTRFSVFLEPLNGVQVQDERSQIGPTAAVSRRVTTDKGDVMATIVGEIPLGTAERVALSIRAGGAPAQ